MTHHKLSSTLMVVLALLVAACAPTPAATAPTTPASTSAAAVTSTAKPAWKPEKAVEVVTQSSAGGGGDVLGRQMSEAIKGRVPQPLVIVNKAGAGGANLQNYVAERPADGHTLIVTTTSSVLFYFTNGLKQDPAKDWRSVIRVQVDPTLIVVRADSPYQTLEQFLAAAKAGNISWSGGPVGSTEYLVSFSLAKAANFKLNYVAYGGGGEATTALLGGHVQAMAGQASENSEFVKAGKLRFLAQTGSQRYEGFKDLTTLKEKGLNVVFDQWRGFHVARATSDEAVRYWHDVIQEGTKTDGFKKFTAGAGLLDGYQSSQDFQAFVEAESNAVKALTTELGLNKQKAP